jgi:oligoendopeptidase F
MLEAANWDLTALYKNEEELDESVEKAAKEAAVFEKDYKGNLKKLNAESFCECVKKYENISQTLAKIMSYAFLKFAENSNNGAFYAKYQNAYTKCGERLLFFELEFNSLDKAKQRFFISNADKYAYFLEELAKQKKHQLNLKTEQALLKKEQTGSEAFARLFDEHFSNLRFSYEGKRLSEEEILSLLHSPNRDTRKRAAAAFTKELKKHLRLLCFIYNMIRRDLKTECELRGYKNAEESRHKDNKITQKSVDALIKAAEGSFGVAWDYYEKKREILGYERLYDYDRYAPLEDIDEEFLYERSREIVLKTFENFSPVFYDIAKKAFEQGWIDVYPKSSKRGGAFSHPTTPDAHPYVLLNHTNKRRDLFTLSHELGHSIHQHLSKEVGFLLCDTPLTTAETASVFAEMLVFDEMKKNADKKTKKAMLSSKIEDIFATFYRQINFTTYERLAHKEEGELSLDEFCDMWLKESAKMFGKSVTLTKDYRFWWSYIPHFIHTPFYCYAYAYGQLLVLALFGLYKSGEASDFKEKYLRFLSLGGGKSPKELVALFGFDIEDEAFWQIGVEEIKKLVNEFKELSLKSFDFLEDKEFVDIVREALSKILSMLLSKDMPFTILTNVSRVGFKPPLPSEIREKFQAITLFDLDGYTLSTAKISEDILSFEAGFGENDFASLVSVPIGAILQVGIENKPIFLNMSVEEAKVAPSKENKSKRSMEALLSNPENQNLIKK